MTNHYFFDEFYGASGLAIDMTLLAQAIKEGEIILKQSEISAYEHMVEKRANPTRETHPDSYWQNP